MVARRIGAVLLALSLAGGLAACGDDGGGDDAVDQVDRDDNGDDSTDDGSGDDSTDDSTDDGSGDDGSAFEGAFEGERCVEMAGFFTTVSAAVSGAFEGEEFAEAQAAFEDAVEDVPDGIRDDFETYVDAYSEYGEILSDAGVDFADLESADFTDPEVLAALTEAGQVFSDPEVQSAATGISEFFANNCQG